jgi:hypothetical protein
MISDRLDGHCGSAERDWLGGEAAKSKTVFEDDRLAQTIPEDYSALVCEIRATMHRELALLREQWTAQVGDREKSILMWRVALLTAVWDVSEGAISMCGSSQYRAARILDRSLSEYAYRLHYYMRHPERAEMDAEQYRNYLRKILKPTQDVRGDMTDDKFESLQVFLAEGGTAVRYETTRAMREDALQNLGMTEKFIPKFLDHLDVEYAVSSGIAHGSQGLLGDVFRKTEDDSGYHERSAWFRSSNLAIRIGCHLILALIGVGQADAAAMHMRSLNLLIDNEPDQSVQIYTENTLVTILTLGFAGRHPHVS